MNLQCWTYALSLNRTTSNTPVRAKKNNAPGTTSDDLGMSDTHQRDSNQAASLDMDDSAEEEEEMEEVEDPKKSKARYDEKIVCKPIGNNNSSGALSDLSELFVAET